jgi:hypothetical protein
MLAAVTPGDGLPADERAHLLMRGHYLGWRATLAWNPSDFYDLFGPTKRSRKGFMARLGHTRSLIFDTPRTLDLLTDVAYFDKIETLPNAQNIQIAYSRQLDAQVALRYSNVRRSLGAVDDEKGVAAGAVLTGIHAKGANVGQLRGNLDLGHALPLAHSSVWSRTVVGASAGERSNPQSSFYFGGFGNNWVDDGAVKRYREFYAMPGFGLNELEGRNFAKQMFEWNLPPLIFESLGRADAHLQSLRPALFASGLWAQPAQGGSWQTWFNLGGQVDLRLSLLHWYDVTLSMGVAEGFRQGRRAGNEWMISLKIL